MINKLTFLPYLGDAKIVNLMKRKTLPTQKNFKIILLEFRDFQKFKLPNSCDIMICYISNEINIR